MAEATSSDTIVKEGEDVLLTCKATGRPEPQIMWRREDGQSFVVKEGKTSKEVVNNFLLKMYYAHMLDEY